jgi:hypothetical protein
MPVAAVMLSAELLLYAHWLQHIFMLAPGRPISQLPNRIHLALQRTPEAQHMHAQPGASRDGSTSESPWPLAEPEIHLKRSPRHGVPVPQESITAATSWSGYTPSLPMPPCCEPTRTPAPTLSLASVAAAAACTAPLPGPFPSAAASASASPAIPAIVMKADSESL